ncbi:tectonic-1-like isoform X2 [Micropterus dolomieu]|uniref:tectonic-1-like isoform X2 n=1 Tax=Micropterus dolomieu TaxID=147949 RepID=UPI001E8E9181|nr:tectonic-1-like isoform X2 [Micropterus dolomieu]
MASYSTSNLFCSFIFFTAVTTKENTTSYSLTGLGEQNVTYNVTDYFTTTQTTEFDSAATPLHSSTEKAVEPSLPPEPLPVTGRLLTPVTSVDRLCSCDEHKDVCDINCCCDRECSEEVALFTGCSVDTVSGNKQLCSRDVASYSLGSAIDGYSELQSSVQKETNYDIFCIQSQNRVDGVSHPSPSLPTDSNFDSLFKQFTSFIFGSEVNSGPVSTAELQASSGYRYGDVMGTAGASGQRGTFWLPAPSFTADCMDTSPAAFLKDQSSRCSRRVVLEQDCSTLLALSIDTYTNIQLFAGKNKDAAVVPVEVDSVVLQSVDGTQTELQISGGENLTPILLNQVLCANVVLKVVFVIKYNPAGEIVNVTVSLVLGFVREAALPLEQEFQITFVQEDGEVAVQYSGNPGYVFGRPLVSGTKRADGIARSTGPRDTLSLLHSAEDQDCLQGPHRRSPVQFGLDSVAGCTLRLEDAVNCSLVFQVLLDVLRGPNYPQYVASFGNSPLDYPLDWVPIKNNFSPQFVRQKEAVKVKKDAQSCSIPLSLHLDIEWTTYGSLVNPQPQIVSIKEVIQTNTSSLALLPGGSSILSIRSSVTFIPVSAAALPGYRATPTINAQLPFDFFFPFV